MESYDEILQRMKEKFCSAAGFEADDATDIGIRLKVLAGEIYTLNSGVEWLKRQAFPQTALGNELDLHALQRGLKRKTALPSSGILIFSRKTPLPYDLPIPKGTVCAVSEEHDLRYITTKPAVMNANQTKVEVPAVSADGGKSGNAAVGMIQVLITPPPGIEAVTNEAPFTGGADEETDEELRVRLLQSYAQISNGTNAAFYKEYALKQDSIQSVSVIPRPQGSGTVALYLAAKSGVPSKDTLQKVEKELNELREIDVKVTVHPAELVPTNVFVHVVPADNCEFLVVKEAVENAVSEYFSKMMIGQPFLLAQVGQVILNTGFVKNYRFDTTNCNDQIFKNTQLAVCGSVYIEELKGAIE